MFNGGRARPLFKAFCPFLLVFRGSRRDPFFKLLTVLFVLIGGRARPLVQAFCPFLVVFRDSRRDPFFKLLLVLPVFIGGRARPLVQAFCPFPVVFRDSRRDPLFKLLGHLQNYRNNRKTNRKSKEIPGNPKTSKKQQIKTRKKTDGYYLWFCFCFFSGFFSGF